jgi:acyl carrier protein
MAALESDTRFRRATAAAGNALAVIDDVRAIIAKSLNIPVERLTPDSRLDELGAESLDVIEIVFALEEKFDITIPLKADEATRLTTSGTSGIQDKSTGQEMPFSTVGDVADIVQKLIAAKVSQ